MTMVGIAAMTSITNAAITLVIDPVGGEQDGIEFDTTTAAGTISQADMQAALTAAGASRAGVFDMTGMTGSSNSKWTDTGGIEINSSNSNIRSNTTHGSVMATSGVNHGWFITGMTLTFDVSSVTNGIGVTHFGLVHIPWTSGGAFVDGLDMTANFSGGGSASLNSDAAEAVHPTGALGDWDTWFGFEAPTGETITSVNITKQGLNNNWIAVDDVSYIVAVPEPSSTALLGLGGLALILRRRK